MPNRHSIFIRFCNEDFVSVFHDRAEGNAVERQNPKKSARAVGARLLKIINVLYRIEGVARENGFTPGERLALRQRRARRVVFPETRRHRPAAAAIPSGIGNSRWPRVRLPNRN
jgi:hypothetical protein